MVKSGLFPFMAIYLPVIIASDLTQMQNDGLGFESYKYSKGKIEQQIITKLMRNYDWRIRPEGVSTVGPIIVTVNLFLRSISKIDDVNMEYSAHFTFREEWRDMRLTFANTSIKTGIPYVILPPSDGRIKIWMPDTFFQNEKDGKIHDIDKPNVLIRIKPQGDILYSVRMTLTLSCPMLLQNYPMDTQKCFIDLASYAYTTKDIIYEWKHEDPVQIKEGLKQSLPSFMLSDVNVTTCTSNTTTGSYSCLRTVLLLKREFSYYLLQLYIPSLMLVAVSWVSFWLDKDSVPARVTLGVTTLLTMTTQAGGINAKLPPVSYTKAIDVWIGVCLAFIFGALLEFALVNYAARRDMIEEAKKRPMDFERQKAFGFGASNSSRNSFVQPLEIGMSMNFDSHFQHHQRRPIFAHRTGAVRVLSECCLLRWFESKYRERSKRIDVVSRFVFPAAFLTFNGIYWINYLIPYLNV